MSPTEAVMLAVKTQLLKSSRIRELTEDDGFFRIFLHSAPGDLGFPLILMTYIWGFTPNRTMKDTVDDYWRIEAIAENQAIALELAGLIRKQIHQQTLPFTGEWSPLGKAHHTQEFLNKIIIQGHPYHVYGANYRIRAQSS